jgi:opacity protein-like surface antigen
MFSDYDGFAATETAIITSTRLSQSTHFNSGVGFTTKGIMEEYRMRAMIIPLLFQQDYVVGNWRNYWQGGVRLDIRTPGRPGKKPDLAWYESKQLDVGLVIGCGVHFMKNGAVDVSYIVGLTNHYEKKWDDGAAADGQQFHQLRVGLNYYFANIRR